MREVKQKRWVLLFAGVTLLVLAQVTWWLTLFISNVNLIEHLKRTNLELTSQIEQPVQNKNTVEEIKNEAQRKRFMFWSESLSFVVLTGFGLFMLYQAFRREEHMQKSQKDFIEVLSHEVKTPLTALKLRLESTREKIPDGPALDCRDYLGWKPCAGVA